MSKPTPRWFIWAGLLALAGYAMFLGSFMAAIAAGADSSGYFNSARLLAEGRLLAPLRIPPEFGPSTAANVEHFMPGGFRPAADGSELAPTYPTGLPLHFAAAARLFGWQAGPFVVQLLAAVAAVWLCYLAARQLGLGPELAVAGAAMLAAFPVFIFTSIQTLSDTLATTWTVAALYSALRARADFRWALPAGFAVAMAVLVRPTNIFLLPCVVVLLGWDGPRLVRLALGGLPGAVWFLLYNHLQYGGAFRTGYGDSFSGFAWNVGAPTVLHFAKWLAAFLPPVVLLLPFAARWKPGTGRERWALGLAVAGNFGLYAFYDVSRDVWWCLRFILPGVASLLLLALLGLDAFAARRSRWFRPAAAALLIAWSVAASCYWVRELSILYVPGYERAYRDAALLAAAHVPPNGVVVSSDFSGSLYFYTSLRMLIWDPLSPADFAGYAARAHAAGSPVFALLFDRDRDDILGRRCPGDWTRVASTGEIGLWQLQPAR